MPREEQISVKLVKSGDYQGMYQKLQMEAEALKKSFGSIQIGNISKSLKEQASAAKEAARAVTEQAKANKEAANSEIAKQKAQQASIDTTTKQIKAQKEAANAVAAEQKAAKNTIQTKSAALRLAQKEAAVLEKSARVYRQLGDEIGKVNRTQAKSYTDMSNYIRQLSGFENATVKATGVIRNSAGTFQTYTASIQNADGTMQQFKFSVNDTDGQVYKLDQGLRMASGGAESFTSSISRAGKQLTSTLKTLVGFYGVAQSLRYAFKEMKSMSDEMIVYQKITKATADEMDRLRASSYDVAKKYGQTPTDFLSAAQEMARAGYKDQSAAMAELAIKTKLVGDITADQASKFLLAVDAGYKYGGSIEKLSMVLDQANEIGNNWATSIDKISEGMTLVASLGAQANVSIEELMAALGTMTAATQRSGSEMARALRFIMLGVLGDTTTEVEEGITVTAEEVDSLATALQHYAPAVVDAAKASGKLINPMEAIGALAKAYKEGLLGGEEDLFKIAKELAGQRYYNAFAALIANWDDMYLEMLDKEREAAGSADAEINVLMGGWTQKLNVLKTTWTELVNKSVQEGFIKDLIDGATAALEFSGNLTNLGLTAIGTVTAFKALSTAIQRYTQINAAAKALGGTGISFGSALGTAGKWGLGLGIAGALAGVALSVISSIKQAKEEAIQAAMKAAQEQLGKTEQEIDKYRSLFEISEKYKKIYSDGIVTDEEKSQLVSMQEQLNTLLGKQAEAIDLVNGKYEDMKTAIDNAVISQLELTEAEINAAKSKTFTAYNGIAKSTSVTLPYDYYTSYLQNIPGFNTYVSDLPYDPVNGNFVFTRPDSYSGMIQYAKLISEMMEILNSKGIYGGLEAGQYNAIQGIYTSLQEAGVYTLIEMIDAYNEYIAAREEAAKTTEDGADASKKSADAMDAEAKAATKLAQAIHDATNAKEKFDEAMKSTKADAMNSYASAYSTLDTEIKEGRVNSTAFYAAARMLLGEEAFKATGGTSQGVMQALQSRGASGSLLDAWEILNKTFVDKAGNEIQGYGLYSLLTQTKGIDQSKLLTDKGEVKIQLTAEDWANVSKQWGGIDLATLMYYANALDQYDRTGAATEDVQKALGEKEESAAGSLDTLTTSADAAAAALDSVAKAANDDSGEGGPEGEGGTAAAEQVAEEIKSGYAAAAEQAAEEIKSDYATAAEQVAEEIKSDYATASEQVAAEIKGYYAAASEQAAAEIKEYYAAAVEQAVAEIKGYYAAAYEKAGVSATEQDDAEIKIEADTEEAEKGVKDFLGKIPSQIDIGIRTYTTGDAVTRSDYTHTSGGNAVTSWLGGLFSPLHAYASGTQGHPGGPALLNDGNGPELVVDRGRAFIAGGGRPTVMNLHRGAKVFSAGKTSALLGRSSIPAYAEGTGVSATSSVWDLLTSLFAGDVKEKPKDDTSSTGSTSSSGGNSGPKVDKESYTKLQTLMNYILNRLNTALEEQTAIIDKQIAALQKEREIQEEQDKLEELQKNLSDAMNERTVRYLGDDGKWHWMADANKVQKAQEELDKYKEELEYNAKIDALEQQKTDLQDQLNEITKVWQEIQDAVETPTGDINELLAAVLKNGTDPQKKAAEYIQNLLIGKLLNGGIYSGNYDEALTAIQAANNGSPFMPTELSYTLASLIAQTGAHESVGDVTESLMQTANGVAVGGTSSRNVYGSPQTFYNYYINGLELGSDQANRPLSDILQDLTVYTNATVH